MTRRSSSAPVERSVVTALMGGRGVVALGFVRGRTGVFGFTPGPGPQTNWTRGPPIVPYPDQNDRSARHDQDPLQDGTPAGCRRQLRPEADLDVQIGGLEEVRAYQLGAVRGDHRADPGGAG